MKTDLSWIRLYALPALAVAGLLGAAIWALDLAPRHELTLAAGAKGSAYNDLAERYRTILARDGVTLTILETAGSVANAEALASGAADAAFLQGGVNPPPEAGAQALAAIFLEPLWIFHRGALNDPADPAAWTGLRIAAGGEGSGTRFVADAVIDALGLGGLDIDFVDLGGAPAANALLADEIDAALFVAPVSAPYLQPLFADPNTGPVSIRDVAALARRLPFVQLATIPPSSFDYAARLPPEQIELVAMVGRLAARPRLHPSLIDRLMRAARMLHGQRDLITNEGQFPSMTGVALPVNAQAATLLASPPSPLYRFLPYWVVAQVNSFALLLVPLLVLLIPMFRIAPSLYQWRMRSRVYRHYNDLLEIDREVQSVAETAVLERLEHRLEAIETDLVSLRLPLPFREYAYTMRLHIDLVRRRIADRRTAA